MERTRLALIYVLLLLPLALPQSSSLVCIKSTNDKSGQACAYQLNSGKTNKAINDLKGELTILRQLVGALNASNNGKLTILRQQVEALNSSNNEELITLRQQVEALNASNNGELTTLLQQVKALNSSNNGELTILRQQVKALNSSNNEELITLRQQVEALNASNNELRRAANKTVNGRYSPLIEYQYKVTPNIQTWDESRVICQGWGGDLVVHGIQTLDSRNNLIRDLSLTRPSYWIGANDKENEGTWKWVNGDDASNKQIVWIPGQPDNYGNNEDCVEILLNPTHNGRSNDALCIDRKNGLCEKPI